MYSDINVDAADNSNNSGGNVNCDSDEFVYPFDMIYAETKEHGIGYEGRLPWQGIAELSDVAKIDMKVFRELTSGAAVIMGIKTALSLPKGYLPARINYILTTKYKSIRGLDISADDLTRFGASETQAEHMLLAIKSRAIVFAGSIRELNAAYSTHPTTYLPEGQKIFVIGGENVYTQFKKFSTLNNIYVTIIYTEEVLPADTYFTAANSCIGYYKRRVNSNLQFGIYSKNKSIKIDVGHYNAIINKYAGCEDVVIDIPLNYYNTKIDISMPKK